MRLLWRYQRHGKKNEKQRHVAAGRTIGRVALCALQDGVRFAGVGQPHAVAAHEVQTRRRQPVEQAHQVHAVLPRGPELRTVVHPCLHERSPTQRQRVQIDHAATGHGGGRRLQPRPDKD